MPMPTRRLPGTDLDLSVIGMGCWTIGGQHWGPVDDQQSVAALRAAVEQGINWFDTAPLYGDGHADRILKQALGPRLQEVILATKVGVRLDGHGPEGDDGHAHSDLRPAHILADAERSLRRLREPLDLLQVHWPCEWQTPLADTIEALERLKERGWIRHWGLCNFEAGPLAEARQLGPVASLQTPYSLLRGEFEEELRAECLRSRRAPGEEGARPLGVLAYEALCRGLLSGKFRTPPTFPEDDQRSWDERFSGPAFARGNGLAQDLAAAGARLGVTAAAIALAWVARQPGITAVIAGARSPEQVRQNAQAARLLEARKLWEVVDQLRGRHGAAQG